MTDECEFFRPGQLLNDKRDGVRNVLYFVKSVRANDDLFAVYDLIVHGRHGSFAAKHTHMWVKSNTVVIS